MYTKCARFIYVIDATRKTNYNLCRFRKTPTTSMKHVYRLGQIYTPKKGDMQLQITYYFNAFNINSILCIPKNRINVRIDI